MGNKSENNKLSPFEKGIDFLLHFKGRKFTLDDIKDRYDCTYRQAIRMRNYVASMVKLVPAGFKELPDTMKGKCKYLWEIK